MIFGNITSTLASSSSDSIVLDDNSESDQSSCGCSGSTKLSKKGLFTDGSDTDNNNDNNDRILRESDKPSIPDDLNVGLDNIISNLNKKMVYIKGGNTYIGTNNPIIKTDGESPQRSVSISSFYLDLYEVSNDGSIHLYFIIYILINRL